MLKFIDDVGLLNSDVKNELFVLLQKKYDLSSFMQLEALVANKCDNVLVKRSSTNMMVSRRPYELSILFKRSKERGLELSIDNYLDVGCNDGSVTEQVANYLKLSKEQTIGVDIVRYKTLSLNINFSLMHDGHSFDLPDKKFDLVTCYQVLHHIDENNLSMLLHEIIRVAKPRFYLVVREHDVDMNDRSMMDIVKVEHMVYQDDMWKTITTCRTEEQWIHFLQTYGFRFIYTLRFSKSNPTKYITMLFYFDSFT